MQTISTEQEQALKQFARANGREWKAKLNILWQRAAAPVELHQLRNSHGPSWLASYRVNGET
jgi:hypothetical protein